MEAIDGAYTESVSNGNGRNPSMGDGDIGGSMKRARGLVEGESVLPQENVINQGKKLFTVTRLKIILRVCRKVRFWHILI